MRPSAHRRKRRPPGLLRTVQELLAEELSKAPPGEGIDALVAAEEAAARAAELGGGGSPVWSGQRPGPGEEHAIATEVGRAIRDIPPEWPLSQVPHTRPS